MGSCPKCKSSVTVDNANCPTCGVLLTSVPEESGTLNTDQHFQLLDDIKQAPQDAEETSTAGEGDNPGDLRGTLGLEDLAKSVPHIDDTSPGTRTQTDENQAVQASDISKTLRLPEESEDANGGEKVGRTQNFSESDLRAAMGLGESGSEGQLMRVWDAAIGSSGKDTKHSLRYERAEASDSVFRRVATRQIADANSTQTEGVDYQIQDKLGDGGMGVVYSALQTAVNRIVAIKTRKAGKSEDEASRRQFFYEAEVTAELDHPNIPPIYELGRTEDGTLFYAMKLIRGVEWQKSLRKKTREENLEIFGKIADAVAFAHSKNVIHRDLKPDNVMLGTFGEVYLTDWGLAVNLSKMKGVDFGGTPEFMAPEMARNQRDQIGKHSDIYLLGAILYQIVTGTPPHMGRNQKDRLRAAIRNEITPTEKDDPLLNIARRAMETDSSHRHASVAELQEAIHEVNRHAESIALAHRSDELAEAAAQSQDYDRFTRAIFGFRDAVEMWDGNKTAKVGLQNARFAYGQCAFDKGDYDLALQTLDRTVPKEAEVYAKATKAKLAVEQRESRFKTLRRAFVAAVSFLLLVASGFWYYANTQKIIAEEQTKTAETNFEDAKEQRKIAEEQTKTANKNFKEAENQRMIAEEQTKTAETNFEEAEKQRMIAEEQTKTAETNFEEAEKQRMNAEEQTKIAKTNFEEAEKQRRFAIDKTSQIKISNSLSELGRANLGTAQLDTQGASGLLAEIKSISGDEFKRTGSNGQEIITNVPKFDTFAWQRVNLLTNADLPKLSFDKVTAMDFAPGANVGIVGTKTGQVRVLRYDSEGLKADENKAEFADSKIDCVAISPNGDQAMFSLTSGAISSTYVWSLIAKEQPIKAEVLGAKSFQAMRYSPDGSRIVVGINGGIRVLTRGEKRTSEVKDDAQEIDLMKNILAVRGDLKELQWIDANTVLASILINKQLSLFELNVDIRTSNRIEPLPPSVTAAALLGASNRVLLASGDGKLSVGALARSQDKNGKAALSISNVSELPTEHRAAITRLVVNADGRILSISDKEPVVHVWRANARGEVTYDTYLTGVPSSNASTPNIINALFASGDSILGVDDNGTTVAWNIERQKQRRQLTRVSESGLEEYPAPVVGVFGRGGTDQAISVTQDGVIDLWNLQTGKSKKIDEAARFSYFGHTPGAVFVDSAVDVNSGVIVTSATLGKSERRYLKNPKHDWEFCVWERSTGNMIKRWSMEAPTDPKNAAKDRESIEPRMTMLNSGAEILIASDSQTLVYTVLGEKLALNAKSNIGTYFAVPNPKDPSLVAMIKRSGLVWLWNRTDANSWWTSDPNNPVTPSRDDEGAPLKGVWTEDGNRFFLVFSSGFVKVYDKGDFRRPSLTSAAEDAGKAKPVLKIREHHDIDLATARVADTIDRLVVNIRFSGTSPYSVTFTLDAKQNRIDESEQKTFTGLRWLDTTAAGTPKSSNRVHRGFRLNPNSKDSVLSRQKSGMHTFVSTKLGTVYDLTDESTTPASIGPQRLISSTSDREGSIVMLLRADGSILRMDLSAEGAGQLNKAGFAAVGFDEIQLSPSKKQLAMLERETHVLKLVDAASGELVREYSDVAAATWDPAADAVMAMIHTDGKIEMTGLTDPIALRNVNVENGWQIKSVHFFNEAWVDEDATRHLLVQSESQAEGVSNGRIEFVALKPELDKGNKPVEVKRGVTIATSPVDSLFATGDDSGTVTVWFASPTWDKPGKIFDLEGHRGAPIKSIAFGENGQTLITSDANNRLYGWISKDSTTRPKN